MNRDHIVQALAVCQQIGVEESDVTLTSDMSSKFAKVTLWTNHSADPERIIAALGRPTAGSWFQGQPIAEYVIGDVRVSVWGMTWDGAEPQPCRSCNGSGKGGA